LLNCLWMGGSGTTTVPYPPGLEPRSPHHIVLREQFNKNHFTVLYL
jgi:hypothetical protein